MGDWRDSEKMAKWKAEVRTAKVSANILCFTSNVLQIWGEKKKKKNANLHRKRTLQAIVDKKYRAHILHLRCYEAEYLQPQLT